MLSNRRQRVLAALIEEYVCHALPVGSRTLVENYGLGVSSATVRNELSVLEGEGYITQPHTSAGRIPTDAGYRRFVDDLLANEPDDGKSDERTREAKKQMRESASELDSLLEQTTAALSRFTESLSIVVPPSSLTFNIRQLSLISITPYCVLIVIVTENGQVLSRQVDFGQVVDSKDLARIQDLFNRVFAGKNFEQIRDSLDAETAEALYGPLARALLSEAFACLQGANGAHSHRLGLTALMQQPEFSNSTSLLPVLQVLEDETVLIRILRHATLADGTTVRIGSENENQDLAGVSVVAQRYERDEGKGVVAVIGPTRMDYARVIQAVRTAKDALEND